MSNRPPGTLDDISMSIGSLQSDVKNLVSTVDRVFKYVKETSEAQTQALAAHAAQNDNEFKEVKKDVEELQGFKSRLYGIAAAAGLFASTIGQYIAKKL